MRRFFILSLMLCVMITPQVVVAQQPSQQTVTISKEMLTKEQLQAVEQQQIDQKIATYGKWVGLGKEVGEAVNGSLSALTTQADTFAKTGVGKFTMFMVAYKVLGNDLLGVLIGIPLMILFTFLFIWSYRRSCLVYSVLVKVDADNTKHYDKVNAELDDSYRVPAQWAHVVVYLICMAILIAIVL